MSPLNFKANSIFHQQVSKSFSKESDRFAPVSQVNEAWESREVFKRLASRSVAGNPGFMGVVLHSESFICDYNSEVFLFLSFVNKLTAVSTHWWNQSGISAWLCMLL